MLSIMITTFIWLTLTDSSMGGGGGGTPLFRLHRHVQYSLKLGMFFRRIYFFIIRR